ncbi:MAG: hypothetical protein ACLS95_00385 [Clostridia bacterium]
MRELEIIELQEIPTEEIISFSKLDTSPVVTLLDDLNYGLFNEFVVLADELKLVYFLVKGTNKVAVIGNEKVALRIARLLQVKAQVMYYTLLKPKKILGKVYTPKRDTNYVIQAFGADGKPIDPFINTEIEIVNCDTLSRYNFRPYKYYISVRGSKNNKVENCQLLRDKRRNFTITGKI